MITRWSRSDIPVTPKRSPRNPKRSSRGLEATCREPEAISPCSRAHVALASWLCRWWCGGSAMQRQRPRLRRQRHSAWGGKRRGRSASWTESRAKPKRRCASGKRRSETRKQPSAGSAPRVWAGADSKGRPASPKSMTQHTAHWTLDTAYNTPHIAHSTPHTAHRTPHTAHRTQP